MGSVILGQGKVIIHMRVPSGRAIAGGLLRCNPSPTWGSAVYLQQNVGEQFVVFVWLGTVLAPVSISALLREVKLLLALDWESQAIHVYRKSNRCADFLANLGTNIPIGCQDLCLALTDLIDLLVQHRSGVGLPRMCNV
ncbi:conserved hypothetical protein [Ricinus communis]|uniref:RNase H type-1 domain-containing protein n=1 Tax=Ricinus communis TaxID=3988 RepID=B9T4N5_RICCO|nr:conserved hypothetical protein [Ricinus communis]